MSEYYEEEITLQKMWEEAGELLLNDFQYYLADALAPAVGYDVRNSILKDHINSITENPDRAKCQKSLAALGELLFQWAEEEAMNEVERNYSPHPRF